MVLYTLDHQSRLRDLMDNQPMFNSIARYEVTSDRLTPTSCIHSSSVSHPIVPNSSLLGPTFPAESGRIALHPRVIDLGSTFGHTNVKFKATKLMEIDDTPSDIYISVHLLTLPESSLQPQHGGNLFGASRWSLARREAIPRTEKAGDWGIIHRIFNIK